VISLYGSLERDESSNPASPTGIDSVDEAGACGARSRAINRQASRAEKNEPGPVMDRARSSGWVFTTALAGRGPRRPESAST
jgi:hypothetical protein